MTNEIFYEECASLLGTTHAYQPFPYHYRTRWNNRATGSGRFPGRGIIRLFCDTVHVALTVPEFYFTGTRVETLDILRSLFATE